jgi:hypothetical protein
MNLQSLRDAIDAIYK